MSAELTDSRRPLSRRPLKGRTLHCFRCVNCSYGASRAAAPERCPMCGGSAWEFEAWRPFSMLTSDLSPRDRTTSTE
jgi:rubrerythrin